MTSRRIADRSAGSPAPAQAASGQTGAGAGGPWQRWGLAAARLLSRHWLVSILLVAGLTLRVLVLVAYRPALIYVDTLKYLYGVYPGSEPLGYRVLLKLILPAGGLWTVALIQHLLGLAMALALYVVLLRRGVSRWLAAVAAAPVLLDAYQLQIEQTIMPDAWFEALIVAALVVLLWRPNVTLPAAVAAGLILGVSATFKQLGEILFLPAVIYVLAVAWRGGRAPPRPAATSATLIAAFALPVLAYCGVSYARTGHFWLAHRQPITGRLVASADCATLRLPAAVRPLCPTPSEQALGPDWLEHSGKSPLYATPEPKHTRGRLLRELDSAIISQQPLRVAVAILADMARTFAPTRAPVRSVTPLSRWQFQTTYPTYPKWVTLGRGNVIVVGLQRRAFGPFRYRSLNRAYGGRARLDRPVAAFLRSYQLGGGYTPGPLLAVAALAGLAGSVLALTRRGGPRSHQLGLACLLFTATAAAALLVPDVFEFSWRYQLPALITLPPAGVLGISAVLARRSERRHPPEAATLPAEGAALRPGGAVLPPDGADSRPAHGAES